MKKIFSLLILVIISLSFFISVNAKGDLDRIDNYIITVNPRLDDGTLDIKIEIDWTVLDSSSEGPLEYVLIGVPNYHVSNLKILTDNIYDMSYYRDSGSFIRIDFKKAYYQGEQVHFEFSFNQSRMYHLDGDYVYYDYNPGYFNEIIVDNCVLKWNKEGIQELSEESKKDSNLEGDYYVWKSKLGYGEIIKVNLRYSKFTFISPLDPKLQYTDSSMTPKEKLLILIGLILSIGVMVLFVILIRKGTNPYLFERGFISYRFHFFYHFHFYHNSGYTSDGKRIKMPSAVVGGTSGSSGHYSGGGCACACACACAGGGRAGCSMKDFYHTNLKSEKVLKELKRRNKK